MFILLPVGVDYRARRHPVVTFTLMGICTLVYLITLGFEWSGDADSVDEWIYRYLWLTPGESHWWTYLTSQFVHGGIMHLVGNMVYLYLFGACVEDLIGRVRFTVFYLLCGIAAAFAHVLVTPDHFTSEMPMGGASGAISGCIGGFLLLLAATKIEFKWVIFFFFRLWNGEFMLPAWLVISFWFLKDLGMMILTAIGDEHGRGGGVAFAAHVGGTLFGMGLMSLEKVRLKRIGDTEDAEEVIVPVARPMARMRVTPRAAPIEMETPTIHLFSGGAEHGPYTPARVQQMFVANEIPADAQYWQEGMDEWRAADELREPGVG